MSSQPAADLVTADLVARLPAQYRHPLVPQPGTAELPASRLSDRDWLESEILGSASRWGTHRRRTLAAIWWYGTSQVLLGPAVAGHLLGGAPLSYALEDLTVFRRADGLLTGARSNAQSDQPSAPSLRSSLTRIIGALAAVAGGGERPYWALATDSLASRSLYFGEAIGDVDQACELAVTLAAQIGPPLLIPVFHRLPGDPQPWLRRQSCCLIYRIPEGQLCRACPRRPPGDRSGGTDAGKSNTPS